MTEQPEYMPPQDHRQPDFAQQIEEARKRLNLPADATAWQVMCENAASEAATKDFLRGLFGL